MKVNRIVGEETVSGSMPLREFLQAVTNASGPNVLLGVEQDQNGEWAVWSVPVSEIRPAKTGEEEAVVGVVSPSHGRFSTKVLKTRPKKRVKTKRTRVRWFTNGCIAVFDRVDR